MKNLKGFEMLNEAQVTTIVGGLVVAKRSSKNQDVDSKSGDSYENDTASASTLGNG